MGGWIFGFAETKANSVQLGLGLGLSLAIERVFDILNDLAANFGLVMSGLQVMHTWRHWECFYNLFL